LGLNQRDINQALQSPQVTDMLRKLMISDFGNSGQRYNFVNPHVEFLANNRLRFQVELTQENIKPLAITVESGIDIIAGRQIQLVQPIVLVNGEEVPSQVVSAIAANVSQKFDLSNLEASGLKARILQLKVTPQKLEIAAFLRIEPSSQLLGR
jgi:hypothetical protein